MNSELERYNEARRRYEGERVKGNWAAAEAALTDMIDCRPVDEVLAWIHPRLQEARSMKAQAESRVRSFFARLGIRQEVTL